MAETDAPSPDVAAIRAGTFSCCVHCPDDPSWHADNPKDSHETSCPTCDRDNWAQRHRDVVAELRKREESQDRIRERLTAERDAAHAALEGIEALHPRWINPQSGLACCGGCGYVWPCPTIAALRGDGS